MPNMDGTGPQGQGPKTGRGAGPCIQNRPAGQTGMKRGFGCGRGLFGRFLCQRNTPRPWDRTKEE